MTATFRRRKAESIDELLFSEVPENWLSLSLKRIVKPKVTDGPHETPELVSNGIPFASAEAVENGIINFERVRGFISYKQHKIYSKKCLPQRNDIFIVKSGSTTGKIGYVNTDIEFNIWSPLALVRANPEYCVPRFLYHALCSELFQIQVQVSWSYGTQPNIGMGVIENLRVFIPPIEQQQAIASFLDRKTAAIDTLIAKKQRLIQLLQKKRTSLINQAVTKGLNPNVPMKDSGIPWIGKIPKHWEICPLKYVTTFSGGSTPDKANLTYWNGSIPWVTPKDMKRFWIGDSIDYITELAVQETSIKVIQPPVVLVVVRGMILAHSFPVAITTTPLTINQDMKTLICSNKIITEFIARQLSAFRDGVLSLVQEAGHGTKALRTDLFEKLPILIPPIEEQKAICSHENKQAEIFNSIIILLNKQIEKLQEYRQSLITAAVTGKIDIKDEVAA